MEAIYENDKTHIPAPIWENVDGSMKDEDFRNNPIPQNMMFEHTREVGYGARVPQAMEDEK